MGFGPIMRLQVGELKLELAPISKNDLDSVVSPGMQQASVTRYLGGQSAPVLETEIEWFDRIRTEKASLVWGTYDVTGERKLIGTTSLHDIEKGHVIQATSGSMIFRKEYWGKGIASAIHKARTWYVFEHLGYTRIKSAVLHGNIASRKALEKSGYNLVYVERNTGFALGKMRHQDNLECINPGETAWKLWWGADRPPLASRRARLLTKEAMEWAATNVELL